MLCFSAEFLFFLLILFWCTSCFFFARRTCCCRLRVTHSDAALPNFTALIIWTYIPNFPSRNIRLLLRAACVRSPREEKNKNWRWIAATDLCFFWWLGAGGRFWYDVIFGSCPVSCLSFFFSFFFVFSFLSYMVLSHSRKSNYRSMHEGVLTKAGQDGNFLFSTISLETAWNVSLYCPRCKARQSIYFWLF